MLVGVRMIAWCHCRGTMHRTLFIPCQPKKAYTRMTFEEGTMHRAPTNHDFTVYIRITTLF